MRKGTKYGTLLKELDKAIAAAIQDDPHRAKEIIINFMDEDTKVSRRICEDLELEDKLSRLNTILLLKDF